MEFICSITLLTFILTSSVLGSCPNDWLHHDMSCYHFSHDTEPMLLASIACQHMGGDLIEIETPAESNYIKAKVQALNSHFLIGLNDLAEENAWYWYGSNKALTSGSFTNWAPNEPNNVGLDESCVIISPTTGQWLDIACHKPFRYICEKPDETDTIVG